MRFWLLPSGDVPLQDQIVAQITLGIFSGELAPGERLPSVRELGRRFHIHANTVSLAYRRLEREHWLECRRGSGMNVRKTPPPPGDAAAQRPPALPAREVLDPLLAAVVRAARSAGVSPEQLRERLDHALNHQIPHAFLLIEPDPILARIVLAELGAAFPLPLQTFPYPGKDLTLTPPLPGVLPLVLPSKAEAVRRAPPSGASLQVLKIRSIPESLAPWLPAPRDSLVGIASAWPPFLDFARTMLVAAGFAADALLIRNAAEAGWQHGLEQAAGVVCDRHTAALLPRKVTPIVFSLLAEQTFAELHALLQPARPTRPDAPRE